MTDITELAQRLKLEVHRAVSNFNPQMNIKTRDLKELVEALEKAQKSNEFLKGQLSELANFNPDWDKLEVSYDSWREIAAELLVAKERIAELESRTVKMPEPFKLAKSSSGLTYYFADDVDAALTAAGIKWEAE